MTGTAVPIRLAVIGTGAISQVVHVPILAEREDVDLVALADTEPAKADAIARRFDIDEVIEVKEALMRLIDGAYESAETGHPVAL